MKQSIRQLHKRLAAIYEMIESCDRMIEIYKSQMVKYPTDAWWVNDHVKVINKYILIRRRLFAWYADVFERMTRLVLTYNRPEPMNVVQVAEQNCLSLNTAL